MPIIDILERVNRNKTGIYNKTPELITVLPPTISGVIGDDEISISEFVVAKIKGLIKGLYGHKEITDEIFLNLPITLNNPYKILLDLRTPGKIKYLFIVLQPRHHVVVELKRVESGKTEINTIIPLGNKTLKQLEANKRLQAVYS